MDQAWLQLRPHLAPLVRTLDAVLKLADEQYRQGRASGDAVDYGAFEERVAQATAKVEQDVHRIELSGLDTEYLSRREHVEPKLIETCELPPGIASVSVSVDRVTVPMEEPVPKEPEGTGRAVRLREETLRMFGHEVSLATTQASDPSAARFGTYKLGLHS